MYLPEINVCLSLCIIPRRPLAGCDVGEVIRIEVLPDEVLLAIFDFYVVPDLRSKPEIEKWISLVHVCRRWRGLVFGSPRHLNLRLFCTPETPSRDTLDVWPSLPLIIDGNISSASSEENIIAALEHNDRIREIDLREVASSQLERVLAAMQVPFPNATHLRLAASTDGQLLPAIPDSFLGPGGSAPCLRHFSLDGIPFLGLSNFLLSTTHLVDLHLYIPHWQSTYISPEAMVSCLSVLSNLENFTLRFQSLQSHPDMETQHSPLATHSVLSVLTSLRFEGPSGYLEDLVARIDAPRLYHFFITFYSQNNFCIPQLIRFISRTPALKAPVEAHAVFERYVARVKLISQTFGRGEFHVQIPCRRIALQLSSLVQVLASSSCPLFTVENLYIEDQGSTLRRTSRIDVTEWWEFLRPFVGVKNIYLFESIAFHIIYSFQARGAGRSIEMLPALQKIFLAPTEVGPPGPDPSKLVQGPIGQFVAARQLLGQSITITVSGW